MTQGRLDDIDLKILKLLQQEGRLDVSKISQRVNLTYTPVQERIRKMQEHGIIKRFTAILDREKIGRPVLVVLMIKLTQQQTRKLDVFEKQLIALPEVLSCYMVSGDWNFIVQVTAATPQAYAIWLLEHITEHDNIEAVQSNFLLREGKNNGMLPL